MPSSLWTSLTGMLNRQTVSDVASQLGEPEQAVSRGLETSLATVVTGVGNKVKEPGALRQIFDLIQGAPTGAMDLSSLASGSTAGGSSIIDMGRRLLSMVFGGSQNAVASAVGRSAGLSEGTASRLLGMAAPMVLGVLGQRVSSERLSPDGFANMVQREASGVRGMLPSGLGDLLNRVTGPAAGTAAHVTHEAAGSSRRWLWPLLAGAAALLALLLLFSREEPRVSPRRKCREPLAGQPSRSRERLPGWGISSRANCLATWT